MSYQVLARKWRPKTFDELAGQEHVLKALVNALENQRLHHAYLFTGTRGVGKTTIARILARALNCETGVTAKPCGECSACQEINEGRFVDLIEVDAASRTKVEDTRELLENIQYRPTRGRYKIYLIDEVHMLSTHSFNALLKTLEEPPEHVKFLLATTDPQKLPVTVLSRCLQFNLKNLTSDRIEQHLEYILGEEKVPFDTEALWHLARAANGSMRDALSLTDQAISHGGGKLSEADVVTMLGTVDRKKLYELMDALASTDVKTMLSVADSLAEFSPDYFSLIQDLLVLMHAVAVIQRVPDAAVSDGLDADKLNEYAKVFSPEDVQLMYQMLLMGQKDLGITPDLHMGFEMLLLRLAAFQPARSGEVLQEENPSAEEPERSKEALQTQAVEAERLTKETESLKKPERESVALTETEDVPKQQQSEGIQQIEPELVQAKEANPLPDQVSETLIEPEIQEPSHSEYFGSGEQQEKPEKENFAKQAEITEPTHPTSVDIDTGLEAPTSLQDLNADSWIALFNALPIGGMLKSLCSHLILESNDGDQLQLILTEPAQKVFENSHQEKLQAAITEYFGQNVQLLIEAGETDRETPAEYADRRYQEKLAEAEHSIMTSPVVQKLVEEFEAELVPGSVRLNAS